VDVEVSADDTSVLLLVRDDGIGGADTAHGSGLVGVRDRIHALGGRIEITSPRGAGTSIRVTLPCEPQD
jgi:signal transduction histidine kinase